MSDGPRVGALTTTLTLTVGGAIALGCGDPTGPPARASAAIAPVASWGSAPALVGSGPMVVDPLDDAPLERLVIALRGDPDPDRRRRAIDAYARHVSSAAESVEPLVEAVATDLDPLVRRWAALALAAAATPDLRPRLRLLAASERDPTVRSILERADVEHGALPPDHGGRR